MKKTKTKEKKKAKKIKYLTYIFEIKWPLLYQKKR